MKIRFNHVRDLAACRPSLIYQGDQKQVIFNQAMGNTGQPKTPYGFRIQINTVSNK